MTGDLTATQLLDKIFRSLDGPSQGVDARCFQHSFPCRYPAQKGDGVGFSKTDGGPYIVQRHLPDDLIAYAGNAFPATIPVERSGDLGADLGISHPEFGLGM